MDWQLNLLFLLWVLVPFAYAWNPIPSTHGRSFYTSARQPKEQPTPQRHFQRQQRNGKLLVVIVLFGLLSRFFYCDKLMKLKFNEQVS